MSRKRETSICLSALFSAWFTAIILMRITVFVVDRTGHDGLAAGSIVLFAAGFTLSILLLLKASRIISAHKQETTRKEAESLQNFKDSVSL